MGSWVKVFLHQSCLEAGPPSSMGSWEPPLQSAGFGENDSFMLVTTTAFLSKTVAF